MSEYWVSTPKIWCKHCSTFVVDSPLGKKNHDATAKHQLALKRFLRDLHRSNERDTAAAASAKREVARLNALVDGSPSSSSTSYTASAAAPSVAKPELKKGERWGVTEGVVSAEVRQRQMRELAALGVALPEVARKEVAMAGEWEVVGVEKGETAKEREDREREEEERRVKEEAERKRKFEELDVDEKAIRGFKLRTREYPGQEEEPGDMRELFKKIKRSGLPEVKLEPEVKAEPMPEIKFEVKREPAAIPIPAALRGEDGTAIGAEGDTAIKAEDDTVIKVEEVETSLGAVTAAANAPIDARANFKVEVKSEDLASPEPTPVDNGVVFKKRKAKSMRKK